MEVLLHKDCSQQHLLLAGLAEDSNPATGLFFFFLRSGVDSPWVNIHNVGVHVLFILWINSQMRLEITFVRKLSDELQANLSSRETVT